MIQKLVVYPKIIERDGGRFIVTAANGSVDGPPLVRFQCTSNEIEHITFRKPIHITIEVGE